MEGQNPLVEWGSLALCRRLQKSAGLSQDFIYKIFEIDDPIFFNFFSICDRMQLRWWLPLYPFVKLAFAVMLSVNNVTVVFVSIVFACGCSSAFCRATVSFVLMCHLVSVESQGSPSVTSSPFFVATSPHPLPYRAGGTLVLLSGVLLRRQPIDANS